MKEKKVTETFVHFLLTVRDPKISTKSDVKKAILSYAKSSETTNEKLKEILGCLGKRSNGNKNDLTKKLVDQLDYICEDANIQRIVDDASKFADGEPEQRFSKKQKTSGTHFFLNFFTNTCQI